MKSYFQQLFDYNYFCNKQIISSCSGLENVPAKSLELFSHILNAHHIWNSRIGERNADFGAWDAHEVSAWEEIHYDNQRDTFGIITNTESFERRVSYENSEGRSFSNSLGDILFHIINHSTHHRGQIALDFRANGIEPPSLDYILYKR